MSAALYLVSALALLLFVSRSWTRLSRRDALVLALLPLVESGEALAKSWTLAPIDLAWKDPPLAAASSRFGVEIVSSGELFDLWTQIIPWQKAVRAALAAGEWPLWNPYLHSGEPLLASYQPAFFHPVQLVSLLCPLASAMTFAIAATMLASCTFFFLLARELGVRSELALVGAAFWSYSSFHLFWLGWPLALATAGVPLVAFGVLRAFHEKAPLWSPAAAGGTWVLLAGNPEVAAVAAALGGALVLALALRSARGGVSRALARSALAVAVAGGVTAIQLVPFLEALPQTAEFRKRSLENDEAEVRGNWKLVAASTVQSLVPLTVAAPSGRLIAPLASGRPNGWIGGFGLVCALFGLFRLRTSSSRFLAGVWFVGWGLAARLPGVIQAWESIPILDLVKPRYGHLLVTLAASCLAALALESAMSSGRRLLMAAALVAMSAYLLALALGFRYLESGISHARIALGAAALLAPLAGAVLLFRKPRSAVVVAAFGLTAVLAERSIEMGGLHRAIRSELFYPDSIGRRLVPPTSEPFRVVGLGSALPPNIATLWGLEDIRGYDPMVFGRLIDTSPLWARTPRRWLRIVDEVTPFHSMLGVRYALSGEPIALGPSWRELEPRSGLHVYENREALGRFFVPRRIRWGATAEERLAGLARQRDFLARAWLEGEGPSAPASGSGGRRNGPCELEIRSRGTGYSVHSSCRRASWLVSSIPAWKGWRVELGGRDLALAIANHAFLAVHAPEGAAEFDVVYRPRSFDVGAVVSSLTLALLALGPRLASLVRRKRDGN